MSNLIANALKFTPIGGRVTVELTIDAASNEAVVSVIDSGIGMSADEQARLFERFSQGDHARHVPGKFGGLGLGLTISKGLIEQHGGTLTAQSVGRNNGSTFTARLPLTD